MYGDKLLTEEQAKGKSYRKLLYFTKPYIHLCEVIPLFLLAGVRVRGWFPRRCVEKCHYDSANNSTSEEKKEQ